ncbi:MAG: phosphate propanoyltransferase [Candidatus Buchananbacteria bacterium]|nr:phosphate propanoyltransferase [Candidatus Buchananbacteria bacterium]
MSKVRIEVSARHLHLSLKDLESLFGLGYKLKPLKNLSQHGEFASSDTVTVKTKGGQIDKIRVIGPLREKTQVEISVTDARKLKINPPVRLSGNVAGSISGTLIGPKGEIKIKEGIIIAQRHLHCNPKQAKKLNLKNGQLLSVKTIGERSLTFHNIAVRIDDNFDLSLHLDTDEGNASLLGGVCGFGDLINK